LRRAADTTRIDGHAAPDLDAIHTAITHTEILTRCLRLATETRYAVGLDTAEAALVKHLPNYYQRGGVLVRTYTARAETVAGITRPEGALRIGAMDAVALCDLLDRLVEWRRYDRRADEWVLTQCPTSVAATLLSRRGQWRARVLTGVISAPTLRPDGSILDRPGYDPATGLLFVDDSGTATVPTACTWFATGNNLTVKGDLITRIVPVVLDPACERPEERQFDRDLHTWVLRHRGRLVTARLTVLRAYHVAGRPGSRAEKLRAVRGLVRLGAVRAGLAGRAGPVPGTRGAGRARSRLPNPAGATRGVARDLRRPGRHGKASDRGCRRDPADHERRGRVSP
jgi:hypothetical protein